MYTLTMDREQLTKNLLQTQLDYFQQCGYKFVTDKRGVGHAVPIDRENSDWKTYSTVEDILNTYRDDGEILVFLMDEIRGVMHGGLH